MDRSLKHLGTFNNHFLQWMCGIFQFEIDNVRRRHSEITRLGTQKKRFKCALFPEPLLAYDKYLYIPKDRRQQKLKPAFLFICETTDEASTSTGRHTSEGIKMPIGSRIIAMLTNRLKHTRCFNG